MNRVCDFAFKNIERLMRGGRPMRLHSGARDAARKGGLRGIVWSVMLPFRVIARMAHRQKETRIVFWPGDLCVDDVCF